MIGYQLPDTNCFYSSSKVFIALSIFFIRFSSLCLMDSEKFLSRSFILAAMTTGNSSNSECSFASWAGALLPWVLGVLGKNVNLVGVQGSKVSMVGLTGVESEGGFLGDWVPVKGVILVLRGVEVMLLLVSVVEGTGAGMLEFEELFNDALMSGVDESREVEEIWLLLHLDPCLVCFFSFLFSAFSESISVFALLKFSDRFSPFWVRLCIALSLSFEAFLIIALSFWRELLQHLFFS